MIEIAPLTECYKEMQMVINLKLFSLILLLYERLKLMVIVAQNATKAELSGVKIQFQLKVTYHLSLKRA